MSKKIKGKDEITEFVAGEVNKNLGSVSEGHLFSALENASENEKLLSALQYVLKGLKNDLNLVKAAIASSQGKIELFFATLDAIEKEVNDRVAEEGKLEYASEKLKKDPKIVEKALDGR